MTSPPRYWPSESPCFSAGSTFPEIEDGVSQVQYIEPCMMQMLSSIQAQLAFGSERCQGPPETRHADNAFVNELKGSTRVPRHWVTLGWYPLSSSNEIQTLEGTVSEILPIRFGCMVSESIGLFRGQRFNGKPNEFAAWKPCIDLTHGGRLQAMQFELKVRATNIRRL
jgi:hypothetical protein